MFPSPFLYHQLLVLCDNMADVRKAATVWQAMQERQVKVDENAKTLLVDMGLIRDSMSETR